MGEGDQGTRLKKGEVIEAKSSKKKKIQGWSVV